MLALDSGQIWWAHDMSSYRGLAVDEENLFVTQSDGIVVALRQRDGSEIWRNDKLKRRGLSAPAVTSTAIAVADYQGYLHWLDKSTGALVARERVAKFRVSSPPVAVQDTVVVITTQASWPRIARRPPLTPRSTGTPAAGDNARDAVQARSPEDAGRRSAAVADPNVLPVVALIGRPNVGKSTLFNAMTGTRDALVADFPGLTRDRQYGFARRTEVPCIVVDTGGLVENADVRSKA
jgi:hypothetical protein